MRHHAKFCEDRSNRSRDMADFRFLRWRTIQDGGRPPSWIYFTRFGTTNDSMQILIFCTLSLKMPIYTPKIGVFGDFTPKMGSGTNETPERHILVRKHVVWRIDRQNRSTFAFVWSYPRPGYIFQVSLKSVQGFRNPRGSKFGLSHYFG